MSDHIEILESALADALAEIQRLNIKVRGLTMAIQLIRGDTAETGAVQIPIRTLADVPHMEPLPDIPSPLEALAQPKPEKKKSHRPPPGRPWLAPGSATYWLRQAGSENVARVRELLRGEDEGVTQQAMKDILEMDSATVSRCVRALWKFGELEFMGREQRGSGKRHSTTNVWRYWDGPGTPPDPEPRWSVRL